MTLWVTISMKETPPLPKDTDLDNMDLDRWENDGGRSVRMIWLNGRK